MKVYGEYLVSVILNPVEDLVERGDYDWVNELICSATFSSFQKKPSFEGTRVVLFSSDQTITSNKVLFEMNCSVTSFRPADIWELLSLSINFPLLQTQNSIVALGSVCNTEKGVSFPILRRSEIKHRRELSLLPCDRDWGSHNKFAFVDLRK